MKIVESAQQRNPEQITEQLNAIVDQLKSNVKTAAQDGKSFDFVERTVLTSVLEIGRQVLDLLLALQGDGNLGETLQTHDGKTAQRSETRSTTKLPSIFGKHVFDQFTYMAGKKQPISVRPISDQTGKCAGKTDEPWTPSLSQQAKMQQESSLYQRG